MINFRNFLSKIFKPKPNPLCDCETDCGAKVIYGRNGVRLNNPCKTRLENFLKPFRQWPWTEIDKGNVVVCAEDGKFLYVQKPDGTRVTEPE